MPKTLLLSFDDEQSRDYFLNFMKDQSKKSTVFGKLCTKVIPTAVLDPQVRSESDKLVALFISGKKMSEGPISTISKMFKTETQAHSANVQIKEMVDGKWRTIRQRLA